MSIEKKTHDRSYKRIHNTEEGIYNLYYENKLNIHNF